MKGILKPAYEPLSLMTLPDGNREITNVLGLDDATLFGRPEMVDGRITHVYAESGFIVVQDEDYSKLRSPKLVAEFEIRF